MFKLLNLLCKDSLKYIVFLVALSYSCSYANGNVKENLVGIDNQSSHNIYIERLDPGVAFFDGLGSKDVIKSKEKKVYSYNADERDHTSVAARFVYDGSDEINQPAHPVVFGALQIFYDFPKHAPLRDEHDWETVRHAKFVSDVGYATLLQNAGLKVEKTGNYKIHEKSGSAAQELNVDYIIKDA